MTQMTSPFDWSSAAGIRKRTRQELARALKEKYQWPDAPEGDESYGGEACDALVHVFARYGQLIGERVVRNREKGRLAFLDLLGCAPIPAQAARTVATFSLAVAARGRLLAAGARLQAAVQGDGAAHYFETERDLWLSPLGLRMVYANAKPCARVLGQEGEPASAACTRYTFEFGLPDAAVLADGEPLELYFWLDAAVYDSSDAPRNALAGEAGRALQWRWSDTINGQPSDEVAVEDETAGFTRCGVLRLTLPPGAAKGKRLAYLRVERSGEDKTLPPLHRVALNSVVAVQAMTVTGEVLGSGTGQANQRYRTTQAPMLEGTALSVLEVLPRGVASASEENGNWVPWEEVSDFIASGPADRHYVLDRQNGEVRFGNGARGMAPPAGSRNVRLDRYRAGGGASGNIAAAQLKVPVSVMRDVAAVTNLFAAQGGADSESAQAMLERAPRALRHRQRAVTQQDYEDLALQASTEVARARCVPLQDLLRHPYGTGTDAQDVGGAGLVSVMIVPHSDAPRPLPTLELLQRVRAYLRERACAEAAVEVVGPLYLPVNVKVSLTIDSPSYHHVVKQEVLQRLAAYLHPLTGGRGAAGWPWGREPHVSDLYAVLDGMDHVRDFTLESLEHQPGTDSRTAQTQRFLVCAGTLQIDVRP
jgi:hypothetical protein